MEQIGRIAENFAIGAPVKEVSPIGNGLINDSYRVITENGGAYVLQRINHAIFKDVELLQRNIGCVTDHIRRKLEAAGEKDIDRKVLKLVPLRDSSATYWTDGSSFWRMTVLIADSVTVETVDPSSSYLAGKSFGEFQAMLSDISDDLGETIPDFHNMELRARQLEDAVEADASGRCADPEVQSILKEMRANMDEMCKAERMHREGILPKRVCHCDTKVSNMLFDRDGNVLCVIDLDTVMPAFVFSDYGDFMRTAGNKVAEDCPDIEKVAFDMDIFRAFTKGYMESASSFLTPVERDNLPYAAALFPFMQAVRFFTDYINGDTYYKIAYPEHNLVRTRNQMALFRDVLSHQDEMKSFIVETA